MAQALSCKDGPTGLKDTKRFLLKEVKGSF